MLQTFLVTVLPKNIVVVNCLPLSHLIDGMNDEVGKCEKVKEIILKMH